MNYWLTTHWPPREGEDDTAPRYGVWVPHDKKSVVAEMDAGDLVFIYESLSGKTWVGAGATPEVRCKRGRGGIVTLARVLARPGEREDSSWEKFTDGTKRWWRYMAPTEAINSSGFVARRDVSVAIRYSPDFNFHGFGDQHSGIKRLTSEEFERLLALFRESSVKKDAAAARRAFRGGRGGPGGEGEEHLRLKNAVADNPSVLLREEGLTLYGKEWKFPTADQADVVLLDRFGQYVAVEVEVDCDDTEVVGPLQSMKYRAMLAYLFDRPYVELRSMLVAYTIHPEVRSQCERHGIRCHEVPRSALPKEPA